MNKALLVATIIGFLSSFEKNDILILQKLGYEVHIACNTSYYSNEEKKKQLLEMGVIVHHIPFERKPFSKSNINAYRELKKLIRTTHFRIIHCHTPTAGVFTRLIARKESKKSTVLYTAHGFHFFKGASIKNWLVFFPIEWLCSFFTDILITINKEDYNRAKSIFHAKKTEYVPGVGVDTKKFSLCDDRENIREELSIDNDSKILISVGELITRKNQGVIIEALSFLPPDVHYILVGEGESRKDFELMAKRNGLEERVQLLGFRSDVAELLHSSDLFVFPSLQEGLPVALMEAMASGIPCVASRIRGVTDLINNGTNGYLCNPKNPQDFAKKINKCLKDREISDKFIKNSSSIINNFDIQETTRIMNRIYSQINCKMDCR